MGRSFLSVRQGVNNIADRWERAAKKYTCGKRVARVARWYPGEGFVGCNDPLEPVVFERGVEKQKMGRNPCLDNWKPGRDCLSQPST